MRDYVDIGIKEGAKLVVDGRGFKMQGYENGFFMGGCLFDEVKPDMKIYKEEIFGPVLSVVRAKDYEEAVRLPSEHEYGNGVAIFTRDGDTARDFVKRVEVGMVGVNFAIPVPLSYYTFGGWKRSGFGDLNQHGPDSIRFYTKTKTVTSRWPSGIKEGAAIRHPDHEVRLERDSMTGLRVAGGIAHGTDARGLRGRIRSARADHGAMAGRWTLDRAQRAVLRHDLRRRARRSNQGAILPEGGCPGEMFTSRRLGAGDTAPSPSTMARTGRWQRSTRAPAAFKAPPAPACR